jgi:hypothetical protein
MANVPEVFGHKHQLKIMGTTNWTLQLQCRDCKNHYSVDKHIARQLVVGNFVGRLFQLRREW